MLLILRRTLLALALFFSTFSMINIAHADRLDDIEQTNTIRIAIFDSNPPFGFINSRTKQFIGYDIDIANAIGKSLGVRVQLIPTNPVNRIPLLLSGKVDLIVANFTITQERAQLIDFSEPYFYSEQKFIAHKGMLASREEISKLKIGVNRGSAQESNLLSLFPDVNIVAYDDTPYAFAALRRGEVDAITESDAKLVSLLAAAPSEIKNEFAIPDFNIASEYQGVGVPKGEARLLKAVNQILTNLEQSGFATKIYERWFGENAIKHQNIVFYRTLY